MRKMDDKFSYYILSLVTVICILIFIFSIEYRFSGFLIRSDGIGYYAYLRSFIFDRDINHYNEFAYFNSMPQIRPSGLMYNQFTIGPAFLWLPFYLCAHLITLAIRHLGVYIEADGYSLLYQASVCIGTIIYISAGLFLAYRICRRYFSESLSLISVLAIWLASNAIYYTIIEPSMSQGVQLFTVSLFIYIWHPPRRRTYKDWVFMGISLGLMVLVHWQSLIFLSLVVVEAAWSIVNNVDKKRTAILQRHLRGLMVACIIAFVIYIPQLLVWKIMFGAFVLNPRGTGQLNLSNPRLLSYLFSPGCSLFTWTPVILLAIFGFIPLRKRDREVTVCFWVAVLLQWYFYSCACYWMGSYGARHFVSSVPLFIVGIAAFFDLIIKRMRHGFSIILAMLILLIAWNCLFLIQYTLKFIPHNGSIFWKGLILGKFQMI